MKKQESRNLEIKAPPSERRALISERSYPVASFYHSGLYFYTHTILSYRPYIDIISALNNSRHIDTFRIQMQTTAAGLQICIKQLLISNDLFY